MDRLLLFGLALLAGQRVAYAPAAVAVGLVVLAIAVGRRTGGTGWVVLFLAAGAAQTRWAGERHDRAERRVRDVLVAPVRCEARATVTGSPRLRGDALVMTARLADLDCERGLVVPPHDARLVVDAALARGDRLDATVQLAGLEHFDVPSGGAVVPRIARGGVVTSGAVVRHEVIAPGRGPAAWIDRARNAMRERIIAVYPPGSSALARALVLGEEDLSDDDQEAFRRSGLAHLLAVSGSHLVVAVLSVVLVLRGLFARLPAVAGRMDAAAPAGLVGAGLAFAYAEIAGSSGSARRAAVMLAVVLLARALLRRPSAPRALGLSLLVLGAFDPFAAFDLSLLLSAAATLGLLVGAGPLAERLSRLGPAARPLAASAAATASTAPLLAGVGAGVSVVGLAVNLVAGPLGETFALPFCLLSAATPFWPLVERGAALVGGGALEAVAWLARVSSSPSWASLDVPPPTTWQLALMLGAAAVGVSVGRVRVGALLAVAAWLVGEGAAVHARSGDGRLRITFLDVGQGDAALIELPSGGTMLVDGGGLVGSPVDVGKRVVLPELAARRRRVVDVAVLSHPHPDHFLGLATVAKSVPVRELWDTGQGEDDRAPPYLALLDAVRAKGGVVRRPASLCGSHVVGGARVEVLAPCPAFDPAHGANDNSLVIRVSLGRRAALLVGDAEAHEEGELLGRGVDVRADVLKLGHHGSRTSSTAAFVAAVHPSFAVASTGIRNRFGHPHPRTAATLARLGVPWAATRDVGAVTWETDGEQVTIVRRRDP